MENCIFCKIVNKEIPSSIVYEDGRVVAFNDIQPVAPVHVLIVPKQHIQNVMDINDENGGCVVDIHKAAKIIADRLGIGSKGFRLVSNCGADAGQTVFHLHYHLIGGKVLGTKII